MRFLSQVGACTSVKVSAAAPSPADTWLQVLRNSSAKGANPLRQGADPNLVDICPSCLLDAGLNVSSVNRFVCNHWPCSENDADELLGCA